jgi:hypothetical protein
LHLALEAETAVGIVNRKDLRAVHPRTDCTLFERALGLLTDADDQADEWTSRCRYRMQSAAVTGFSELMGEPIAAAGTTERLFATAHELTHGHPPDSWDTLMSDLVAELEIGLRRARDLRIRRRHQEAEELLHRPSTDFYGTGAEADYAEYQFQRICALIAQDRPAEASAIDDEAHSYWQNSATVIESSLHRLHHGVGLALLAEGRIAEAITRLDEGRELLRADTIRGTRRADLAHEVKLLSLLLSSVSARLALGSALPSTPANVALARADVRNVAGQLLAQAVDLLSSLRVRWRVVARTRSPLSVAFRRIYGEIALMAAELGTADAAHLGLVVATTVKQTGFALLLREQRSLMVPSVRDLVERIVLAEYDLDSARAGESSFSDALAKVSNLRNALLDELSPLLANLIIPQDRTLTQLFRALNGRHALDYLQVDDVHGKTHWFRSVADPSGSVSFDEMEFGPYCRQFLHGSDDEQALSLTMTEVRADDPIWTGLATELLPRSLRRTLGARDKVIELVISPHDELGYLPWAALHVNGAQPLVTAAVITQTPMLECLTGHFPTQVSDSALVCLTGRSSNGSGLEGLDITAESRVWELPDHDGSPPIYRCLFGAGEDPVELAGSLPEILGDADLARSFDLAHVAGHGKGSGLAQAVRLASGSLTAGRALSLTWPRAVMLRACHVGKTTDLQAAEPYGMVMALLAGGARTVLAGLLQISDPGTAEIFASIVARLAAGTRLEQALREAQLEHREENVYRWGLLGAYVI